MAEASCVSEGRGRARSHTGRALAALVALGLLALPARARADTAADATPPAGTSPAARLEPGGAPAPAPPRPDPARRRDPAYYRGRVNYTTAGEALSWVPRVALSPLYLVAEFGVRRPVYAVAAWADRNHVPPILQKVFEPTPDVFWSPTAWFDLGMLPSVGGQVRWRNALAPGHEFRASVSTGGADFWHVAGSDLWHVGVLYFGARADFLTRPDRAFYGFGPRSGSTRTYYTQTRYEGVGFVGVEAGYHLRAELSLGARGDRTSGGYAPSIETLFPPQQIPGYGALDLLLATLDVRLDTRRHREQNDGVRLWFTSTLAGDVNVPARRFVTAEADLEAAVEVSHPDRVLTGRLYAADSIPLGSEPVPFTYQSMLGWNHHYGFHWGRYRGESAVMAEVRYRYPIAYFVDALWVASVGNVFNRTFSDFSAGALTGSVGVGLRTRHTGMVPLEAMLAFGSGRFDEPFALDSVRLYVGTSEGL